MSDFTLLPRESKPIVEKPKQLPVLLKKNPELVEEVIALVTRAQVEERLLVEKELGGSSYGGQDSHYNLYNAMQPIGMPQVQNTFIFGQASNTIKESVKNLKIDELKELKALYESINGADISQPTANVSTQAGIVLKKRQTESEFRLIQLIVNSRYYVDPFARNIIDNLTRYIIGNGVRITVADDEIQAKIDEFSNFINITELFKDYIKTVLKDGEGGICLESKIYKGQNEDKKGVDWDVYKIFSEEIRGFEFESKNPGKKFAYYKQIMFVTDQSVLAENAWISDIAYWYQFNTRNNIAIFNGKKSSKPDLTKEKVMLWHQMGDKRELRGRCMMEPVLRDLRLVEDFRINRAIMNYERSKVLYVKTQKTTGVNRRNQSTEIKKSASPKGGTQLTIGPNEDYKTVTANLQAQDADADGLLFLYAIGAGVVVPVYLLGMRSDQVNYSAIKNTDSPFHQMILDYAGDFSSTLKQMYKWVIYRNVEAGTLEKTTKIKVVAKEKKAKWEAAIAQGLKLLVEKTIPDATSVNSIQMMLDDSMIETTINTIDIPIEITIADAVKPNPLELAKAAFIERKLSIVSSQTLSEKRGYIWSQELVRLLNEKCLGLWPADNGQGNVDSSSANSGLDAGGDVNTGDGTTNQNSK